MSGIFGPSPQSVGNADATDQEQIWNNIIQQQEQYNNKEQQQARTATADLGTNNSGYAAAGASRPALGGVQSTPVSAVPVNPNQGSTAPLGNDATATPQVPTAGATPVQQPAVPNNPTVPGGPQGVGAQLAAFGKANQNPNAQGLNALMQGFGNTYQPKKKQPQPQPQPQPVQTAMNGPS